MGNESMDVLQPGQIIRPILDQDVAKKLIESLYGLQVLKITELISYDDKNYKIEVDQDYNNSYLTAVNDNGYILKILNSLESKKEHVQAEHATMFILSKNNINCPLPVKNKTGDYYSLEKIEYKEGNNIYTNWHIVRLMIFVPGIVFHKVPYTKNLFFQSGEYLAKLTNTLKGWTHHAFEIYETVWMLQKIPQLRDFLFSVKSSTQRKLAEEVISEFQTVVLSKMDNLPKGVIHGDFNEQNILVQQNNENKELFDICGILDFGDSSIGCFVFDLAINIMYMMLESKSVYFLDVGGHVIAGYLKIRALSDAEWSVLKTCVAARFAQSMVMGAYSYAINPSNEYLLLTQKTGWSILDTFQKENSESMITRWRSIISEYV